MSDQRRVVLIVGKTGTGKSTKARELIAPLTRVFVLEAGFKAGGEYGIFPTDDFQRVAASLSRSFFRVSYSPRWWEWSWCMEAAKIAGEEGGPLWLVIEEADRVPEPRELEIYDDLINRGRHWGINLVALSTRPAKLPIDYRAQATDVIAFRQHEPRDIDYLREIMGDKAEALPALGAHGCVVWRQGK